LQKTAKFSAKTKSRSVQICKNAAQIGTDLHKQAKISSYLQKHCNQGRSAKKQSRLLVQICTKKQRSVQICKNSAQFGTDLHKTAKISADLHSKAYISAD
jgi:glutamate synthase domain-containing protein 3